MTDPNVETRERWLGPGVAGIGTASFLADVGHEIPTVPLPNPLPCRSSPTCSLPWPPARPPEADGGSLPELSADLEPLRWFVLPRECLPG
jgi:hypothetical protein